MKPISDIGQKMLALQQALAEEYGYKPIEPNLFLGDIRQRYKEALPAWCITDGSPDTQLYTLAGTHICTGYTRIVIGDYGAFVEISPEQINNEVLQCQPGQEYRSNDPRFADKVKYLWLTAKDRTQCKIYLQKKTVSYADYLPGMYYISPYEVDPEL